MMIVQLGKYKHKKWYNPFSWGKRRQYIHIDRWDTWNLDHTLALIIYPALLKLKEEKPGSPFVDNKDVPEELHNNDPEDWNYENDEKFHERFDYVLDEMIHAFKCLADEDWDMLYYRDGYWDMMNHEKANQRIANGLRLFAKYYRGLWT